MTRRLSTLTVLALVAATGCSSVARPAGAGPGPSLPVLRMVPSRSPGTVRRRPPPAAPAPPTTVAGVAGLEEFSPESATTWWALVSDDLTGAAYATRTADRGVTWRRVFTAPDGVAASAFLDSTTAWIATGTDPAGTGPAPLYRTGDAGRSWRRVGSLPGACQLQFVDPGDGWCSVLGGALGSMGVRLYRTTDGGATWALVSVTDLVGPSSTGALPGACDKTLTFTSPDTGWAASYCNGGDAWMDATVDAGRRWFPLGPVPLPVGSPVPEGDGLGPPAVSGTDLATAVDIAGPPDVTAVATSTDGGRSWHSRLVRPATGYWEVDLIDPTHWRLTDGTVLMATDDAGATWRTWTPTVSLRGDDGTDLRLDFLNPLLGWAVPDGTGGPLWRTVDGGRTWRPVTVAAGR